MDVQNSAESEQTRLSGASPSHLPSDPELDVKARLPASLTAPSSPREPRIHAGDGTDNPTGAAPSAVRPEDLPVADRDSEAETIVLPGKDGHSPFKARKVRQEDRSDSDGEPVKTRPQSVETDGTAAPASAPTVAPGYQLPDNTGKKRAVQPSDKPRQPRAKKVLSSGLSSAPESPPPTRREPQHQNHQQQCRRPSDATRSFPSDGEQQSFQKTSLPKLPSSVRDKVNSTERTLPHKRKFPITESDDEADIRKARRQRTSSANPDGPRPPKDVKSTPARPPSDALARSVSPQPQQHRRSISSILPSQSNGTSVQKKCLPPPLQPTDYQSDDSSVSGSPHPRSSKLRSLATPATADSTMYPAKMAPHKKHLDAHGQTLLARACARGEYDTAKLRLAERPEDLNVADYAGNTPLQIASLHGSEDIVQLLIDAGCNLDCVNYDKDTPLLDAVDNGHIGVVRLLLDAGVNPRKANVSGQEPLDRVSDETNNADEIRAALVAARKRAGERRRTSEDRHSHPDNQDVRDSHAPESPRRSPPATASTSTGRRSGTVRSTKTRNDLLYMPLDDKTLRQAAGRGDKETVARILQVKEAFDDPESMVAAARGGHDLVIQLLLGLGGANPDPGPVPSVSSDFATPILAAIGQENIKVIELLLEQQGFDPTRRFKGDTYYEIAHRRQGINWKEEEQMLKNAYDDYRRAHKDNLKVKSPQGLRERERDPDDKPPKQDEVRDPSRSHRRNHESPSHDDACKKRPAGSKTGSPREKKRPYLPLTRTRDEAQTRIPGRARKDPPAHASDREVSPVLPPKPLKSMRAESDLAGLSSEGETAKSRRKLVSKGELSKERDRKRATQEPASPREPRSEDVTDKTKSSDKYNSRTKGTKRDEREHTSADAAIKRQRMSTTPDRLSDADKDLLEGSTKRCRLDAEIKLEKRLNRPPCIDERNRKPVSSRHRHAKAAAAGSRKEREGGPKEVTEHRKPLQHGQSRSNNNAGDRSIHVKSEDVDVLIHDLGPHGEPEKPDSAATEQTEEEPLRNRELGEEANCEEEWRNIDDEEKKRKQEEEDFWRQQEEEKKARRVEEERNKREEEEARKRRELADRERREAEEAARRQAEEKKRLEEERRRKEEKERKKRDEEERLRKEQLAREAAEEAWRQREEEERKERERRDRAHREEVERKRAAREAEQKRIREEQERARLDKLPPLLRWLDLCPNPKTSTIAEKFRRMVGARYDTIRQEANGTPAGREQWILNIHVALLLGEKDLDLSRYTAWEREPASNLAKLTIWRTEWACYALLSEQVWDLGRQLPGYYGVADPSEMDQGTRQRLKEAAWDRFLAMDLFLVKVSDFMYTVPNIPHLRNIKLAVEYRELLETEAQLVGWRSSSKWKQDPGVERFFGFAPRHTYYVNGVFTGEEIPTRSETSKTPFPEVRVPRRGFVRAYPTDPDYERLCIEQGLEHLITGPQTPTLLNGVYSSPPCQNSRCDHEWCQQQPVGGHFPTHVFDIQERECGDCATAWRVCLLKRFCRSVLLFPLMRSHGCCSHHLVAPKRAKLNDGGGREKGFGARWREFSPVYRDACCRRQAISWMGP